ncbi:MAG TPA: hypothetical protein PK993_02115 [Clostridia bacterium]|nr:hypothetical protein [Clostridia bacterium]
MNENFNNNENRDGNINFEKNIYSQYVRYKGEDVTYYNNSTGNTGNLKDGMIYKVLYANINSSYTNLTLQELNTGNVLDGEFNSCMFTSLDGFIAIAMEQPNIGQRMNLVRVVNINKQIKMQSVQISPIIHIDVIAKNIIAIITRSSAYIVNL